MSILFAIFTLYLQANMNKSKSLLWALLLPSFLLAQQAPEPYGVLPSERQLRWHEMETYCLIHYTPTTFQNKEWGYGDADPEIFNPTKFDAKQIAQAAKTAGFNGLISVAKHHDGFCLWPTSTTDYSVASSPWENGKGDMVKEFMIASKDAGLAFGVYLSAWDRNDTRYASPEYVTAYQKQLTELMTGYGPLFTSWHDGANGGDGYYGGKNEKRTINRTTYYQWKDKTWPIVRQKQPMAMIFSDVGPDMRWVGNEKGFAAETSWATFTPQGIDGRTPVPGDSDYSTSPSGTRNGKYWIPAECDVPQRPGWFYHEDQNSEVKTPNQLFEIYLKSVGRGANMNLGLAPMPEGKLHDNDVKSLAAFGRKLKETFAVNLAEGAQIKASNVRGNSETFGTANLLDDDRYSYFASDDHVHNPELEITLPENQEFDLIRLRENIKLGQRIDSVNIEVLQDGDWAPLAKVTSIGSTRLIKLDKPVSASRLKLTLYAPVAPALSDFGLFKEFDAPFSFDNDEQGKVELTADQYAVVGSKKLARAIDENGHLQVSLKHAAREIIFAINAPISGLGYLPNPQSGTKGTVLKYEVFVSEDAKTWTPVTSGEFSNIRANPVAQRIDLRRVKQKYIKFKALENVESANISGAFVFYK